MKFFRTEQGAIRSTEQGPTTDAARDEAKREVAKILDDALAATKLSNAAFGEAIGVGATRVRKLCSKAPDDLDVVANLADLLLAPESVAGPVLVAIKAARLRLHGPPLRAETVEDQADLTAEKAHVLVGKVLKHNRDGVLDTGERQEIAADTRESLRAHERLLAMLGEKP